MGQGKQQALVAFCVDGCKRAGLACCQIYGKGRVDVEEKGTSAGVPWTPQHTGYGRRQGSS